MSNDVAIQPVDEISPASKEVDECVLEIRALLDNSTKEIQSTRPSIDSNSTKEIQSTRPSIDSNSTEEIPSIFGNWKCLDDFGDASFLPETIKWQFVAFMERWFDLNVRTYVEEFQQKKDDVWRCYRGVDEQFRAENSKRFIEHLLANSCFLIFAMVLFGNKYEILRGSDKSNDTNNQRIKDLENLQDFIIGDQLGTHRHMLTMDYQIPWFVVEAVYTNHSKLSNLFNTPIHKLALSYLKYISLTMHKSKVKNDTITLPPGDFKHLLHIFHWSRTPQRKYLETFNYLPKMDKFYIPRATELQLSATVSKEHAPGGIDVSFYGRGLSSGVMQLQSYIVTQDTSEMYKHLLAFEKGYGIVCGFPVTAYFACMVCLLQTEADVRLLQDNGIIIGLRDEKDILSSLQWFKGTVLSNDIPMSEDLWMLSRTVRIHLERKSIKYYREFKRSYCSTPWITISVIGAFLIFVLTFIQTIYSTLSYYKQ